MVEIEEDLSFADTFSASPNGISNSAGKSFSAVLKVVSNNDPISPSMDSYVPDIDLIRDAGVLEE